EQARHAAAADRRDGDEVGPLPQAALQLRTDLLDRDLGDVPLGEHDQRRAMGLARDLDRSDVSFDDSLARVDQDERDVGAPGGVEGAELGVVLDSLPLAALPAKPWCRRAGTSARRAR